ncbi:LuxR C-terminal-related transcriptional regulator [Streptomyces sp. NPDC057199]|uniref:LuxR C-terminal-related transcriptional regulator n=1 Tax=Streptomyces sp. NPDC057199 TaxID=3346047 RepID=UPI0036273995
MRRHRTRNPWYPLPGPANIADVAEEFRYAGLEKYTSARTEHWGLLPERRALPCIIKDALTNTHKHVQPPVEARVTVSYLSRSVRIAIEDNAARPAVRRAGDPGLRGSGQGLIGMSERAQAAGGTLTARPVAPPGTGFRVESELPLLHQYRESTDVTIRVLIAEDKAFLRGTFRLLIDSDPDMEVVAEAATRREAVLHARLYRADVAVMDIRMSDLDGLTATRLICNDEALAGVKVLILSTLENDRHVAQACSPARVGSWGKRTSPQELLDAINVVSMGEMLLSPVATRSLVQRFLSEPESETYPRASETTECAPPREREVLLLVARGKSNQAIADELVLSPITAKTHVNRAMSKLDARDRAQLMIFAYGCPGWCATAGAYRTRSELPRSYLSRRRNTNAWLATKRCTI